ncbi:MAG TPA: hypothetical protein DEW22_06295 [Clostridiales bacterium]|nr:YegS/Rv2252/BmrU family lipid kinase [Clostridiales bacterium]HCG68273.1 hypothetical protein [Clostridiales bacterium]
MKLPKIRHSKKAAVKSGAGKQLLFIINPVSGRLKARSAVFDMLEKICGSGYMPTVALTQYRGHARELAASAAAKGYSQIICCGGDGTLNEVISGVISSGCGETLPIGYIPAGSTNDFAASIGIPTDLAAAADAAATGESFTLDIGKFGDDRYFTYIASFGAFTAASYSAPQNAKNNVGHLAYVFEGIKEFFKIKPIKVVCDGGDKVYRGDYVFGGVTNSLSVGGLVKLSEDIVGLDDGLFEVILIKRPKNVDEFNQIVQALLTSNLDCRMIDFFRTSRVSFRLPEDTVWTLDGERAECGSKVELQVLHNAIKLKK